MGYPQRISHIRAFQGAEAAEALGKVLRSLVSHGVGGQRDNEGAPNPRLKFARPDGLSRGDPAHDRHLYVHEDQVPRPTVFPGFQGGATVGHDGRRNTRLSKQRREHKLVHRIVFRGEDPQLARRILSRGRNGGNLMAPHMS